MRAARAATVALPMASSSDSEASAKRSTTPFCTSMTRRAVFTMPRSPLCRGRSSESVLADHDLSGFDHNFHSVAVAQAESLGGILRNGRHDLLPAAQGDDDGRHDGPVLDANDDAV